MAENIVKKSWLESRTQMSHDSWLGTVDLKRKLSDLGREIYELTL